MVPTTYFSILAFVAVVAPGFLFDLLSRRRRIRADESVFGETVRLVFSSLVFSLLAIIILAIVRVIAGRLVVDIRVYLSNEHAYAVHHYALLFWDVVAELVIACALAGGTHALLMARSDYRLHSGSVWKRHLGDLVPVGAIPIAWVRFDDGSVYSGRVADFTHDLDVNERELTLAPPIHFQEKGGSLVVLDTQWSRVLIHGAQVKNIVVRYQEKPEQPASAGGQSAFRRLAKARIVVPPK